MNALDEKNVVSTEEKTRPAKPVYGVNALEWYESLVGALAVMLVLFVFLFRVATVRGSSMVPTLTEGDRLLLQCQYTAERGDVIVVDAYSHYGELYGKPLVKRIIATEGDEVDIDFATGVVSVNGSALDEPYTAEPTRLQGDVTFPVTVPQGFVFVMGDNRMHSEDSRFSEVGFIEEESIVGKVLFRILPLGKIGAIE